MMPARQILAGIFLLGCLSRQEAFCQQTDNMVRQPPDSVRSSWVDKLANIFDFNDPDPRYIRRNKYDFMLMMSHYSSFEEYRLRASRPYKQSLSFSPEFNYRIGAYIGWRWLFAGWSVDALDFFGKESKRSEFSFNIYTAKLGLDLYYITTKGFRTKDADGFATGRSFHTFDFDGLRSEMKGINLYYVFNSKYFSQPASFGQATNQLRNAGSWIAGLSYSTHKLTFDYASLPAELEKQLSPTLRFGRVRYVDYSLNFGYAYNWAFAKNCVASASLTPAVGYQYSRLSSETTGNNDYRRLGFGFIARAGIAYNNLKHFVGSSLIVNKYDYRNSPLYINNTYALLQLYFGFYFGKKNKRNR